MISTNDYYEYGSDAILSCSILYPVFHFGLYSKEVSVKEDLCSEQGNSSKNPWFIIESCFKSRAGYNGAYIVSICSAQSSIEELVTPQYAFATLLIVSTIDKVKTIACKPYLLTLLQWVELNSGVGFLFWHISNFY